MTKFVPSIFNLSVFLLMFSNVILGQTINTQWRIVSDNEHGNRSFSMASAKDGSFTIAGKIFLSMAGTTPDECVGLQRARVARYNTKGELLWKRCLGVGKTSNASVVVATSDNGVVVGGIADEDPSIIAINPNYKMETGLVYKLDSGGNVLWKAFFGGTAQDHFISATETSDKGIVLLGVTNSSNGDISGYHMPSNGQRPYDIFLVKYDQSGNRLWTRCYGGTGMDEGAYNTLSNRLDGFGDAIKETPDGGLIFVGSSNSTNGDVTGNHGQHDAWIVKVSHLGQIQWQKSIGGLGNEGFHSIKLTKDGGFIAAGNTASTEGDISGNNGGTDALIVKFSNAGVIEWQKCIGGSGYDEATNIMQESDGAYVCVGNTSSLDGNFKSNNGQSDAVIFKLNNNGQMLWYKNIGGSDRENFCSILPAEPNNYIVCGYTYSKDLDLGGCKVGPATILFKLGEVNIIKGNAFIDMDADCTQDIDEPLAIGAVVHSSKNGIGNGGLIDSLGNFFITVDTGSYSTDINLPYFLSSPDYHFSTFDSYQKMDSVSFCLTPVPGIRDLRIDLIPLSIARPGSLNFYKLICYNVGTELILNDTVKFVKETRANFIASLPKTDSIVKDTLIWIIPLLEPLKNFEADVTIELSPFLRFGDTVTNSAFIYPVVRDTTPEDNISILKQPIRASFDPNDKYEFSGGSLSPEQITKGEYLQYHIRFQNTGNDTAFKVIIRDTLDINLDWTSLQMIKASHPYNLHVTDNNKLAWVFDNILLPDSNVNEPKSHGYISYRVKPKANMNLNDTIKNTASIYFDFNTPVRTNITQTFIKQELPPLPQVTDLSTDYCSASGEQKGKITNMPTSGSKIIVTVKIDNNAIPIAPDSTFSFDVSRMDAGVHTVTVQFSNASANRITSFNFTIAAAVTPDVNVSANMTTISDLNTNVILTAQNISSGGNAPLYTFARDREFINMMQAEGAANTCTIHPSVLVSGLNKIYVKMRSNAACVVTNTAIDSILLERSVATGISDPDMPGQVILVYPNPFKYVITINGLNPSKTYSIRLVNPEGKVLSITRVSGRSSVSLNRQYHANGTYLLSIYDEKRKRLLGTLKLSKD